MSKVLDNLSQNNADELNKATSPKSLCVHDLKKKLRAKQKKQYIKNSIVLLSILIFFGVISLLVYQKL